MTRRLLILACSGTKRPGAGRMPALERYDGPLWQTLRTVDPDSTLARVAFLSARYGFGDARFHDIEDYDARLGDELAGRMIGLGMAGRWPEITKGMPHMTVGAEIASMSRHGAEPFDDVAIVGGALYLTVMRALVAGFRGMGCVTPGAVVSEINGPIGYMRRDLRAWLGVLPDPETETDDLGGELVEQAILPTVAPVSQSARLIEAEARRRTMRRGHASPPAGGLFDDVARAQQDLF